MEWPASLMKEVAIREYKGGYSGFSFPVGKTGIRYKVGGSRGHSVQVGTKLDVADTGTHRVSHIFCLQAKSFGRHGESILQSRRTAGPLDLGAGPSTTLHSCPRGGRRMEAI
jgi:hypothetical protein